MVSRSPEEETEREGEPERECRLERTIHSSHLGALRFGLIRPFLLLGSKRRSDRAESRMSG